MERRTQPRPAALHEPLVERLARRAPLLALAIALAQPCMAWAQPRVVIAPVAPAVADEAKEGENLEGVFLPPDRQAKRRLESAGELLGSGHYGDASRLLDLLLESPEDYFFKPDPNEHVYRSFKAEAGRLIGQMPAEGRASYELQFDAPARHMLNDAVAAGDIAAVAEVARRFFYTQAGFEAMLLVGRDHLDHGRPLAAALSLQRLRDTPGAGDRFEPLLSLTLATAWVRAGALDKAQRSLVELKRRMPQEELRIGDRAVGWFNDPQDALAWLSDKAGVRQPSQREAAADQWLMFRGDAARNAASLGGQPLLDRRWSKMSVYDDASLEKPISQLRQGYGDQDVAALPSMQPLAVGDVVLMRTVRHLVAVDFRTGKYVWAADSAPEQIVSSKANALGGGASVLQMGLEQRMWDDAIFGNLTSDGQQVFAIEDLPLLGGAGGMPFNFANNQAAVMINARRMVMMPNGRIMPQSNARSSNRLKARELKTEGKLRWSVGGASGDDEPRLAGAYFLGPPLPVLGRLYVLAEMKGQEIRLLALSAKTGRLEWSQQLAMVEQSVLVDPFRRGAGAVPSFADGILVCPTSAGAIVAVDLTTRSLLWGYQYPRNMQGVFFTPNMFNNNPFSNTSDHQNGDRWMDSEAILADGRVLLTPVEDDKLYCLGLVDGKLHWKLDRGAGAGASYLYIGCVRQGNVLLVGHRHLAAVRLADGQPAWGPIELPSAASPSGRGFMAGGSYFLPLSTAEVAEIDLETGAVLTRSRSRQGVVPGNLICYRGDVISQNVDFVEVYPQLASLKKQTQETLARSPDDPAALAQSGEIRLDEGHAPEAIALLRRSYGLKPDDRTRELLIESVLAGLEKNFAENRDAAQELKGLLGTQEQRSAYQRLFAIGLERAGQIREAFDCFLKVVEDEKALVQLEAQDETLQVRRDRWIRRHLAQLWQAADADTRAYITAAIEKQAAAAAQSPPAALEKMLNLFGSLPAADALREVLAERLSASEKLSGVDTSLKREHLFLRLLQSPDPARVRGATAQLAALLRDARRPELAAIYYRQLAGPLAGQVCWQGQTGGQIVAELPADSPAAPRLADAKPFPVGAVEAKSSGPKMLGGHMHPSLDLDLRGATGPFFDDVTLALDRQQSSLLAEDGLGVERFRVSLSESEPARRNPRQQLFQMGNHPAMNYASVYGNQVFLWMGFQLVALDTLRGKDAAGSRVLWSQELQSATPGVNNNAGVHPRSVNVPWGPPRYLPQTPIGRLIGMLGPASDDGVCFQRFRDLVCVDPITGEELWVRKGLPLGCQIFGDDEVVIAAPAEGGEALVVRKLDGELLVKRDVPPVEQRMATIGRMLLSWRPRNGKWRIELGDLWKDATVWSREAEFGAKGDLADNEFLGIFESGGHFSLLRVSDGKVLADREKLRSEHSLTNIHLLASDDALLLMTNGPSMRAGDDNNQIQAAPTGRLFNPLVNGRLYGFDRGSGKRLWGPVKIERQGMLLHQPAQLPVLLFARLVQRPNAAGQTEARTSVLLIDKRTGRKDFEDDKAMLGGQINNLQIVGDRKEASVALLLPAKTIMLKFTDKAIPPEPPPEKDPANADPVRSAAEALGKALEGVLKPLSGDQTEKNGEE